MYSGYGIVFDGLGSWSFGNDFFRNVVIFDGNSSSSHADNCKYNFLVLVEGSTDGINGNIGAAQEKFCIKFCNAKTKFCLLTLRYNSDGCYLFVNEKKK